VIRPQGIRDAQDESPARWRLNLESRWVSNVHNT